MPTPGALSPYTLSQESILSLGMLQPNSLILLHLRFFLASHSPSSFSSALSSSSFFSSTLSLLHFLGGSISPGGDKFERTPTFSGVFQEEGDIKASQTSLTGLSSQQRAQLARESETLSQEHSRSFPSSSSSFSSFFSF